MFQGQGDLEFQPAGILLYFEELKREINTEIGIKDIFKIGSGKKMGGLTGAARGKEGGMDKKESMISRFHGS
mgnify:CR=1 FL=1